MTYSSGTQTVTVAGAQQDMLNLIEAAMTAAGWVFVEQHTTGWRIWKCPSTLNGVQDFHVAFSISGGFIYFGQFEDYNASTHQYQRGMYTMSTNAVVATANWDATSQSPFGTTWTTLTTASGLVNAQLTTFNGTFPTSQFDYLIRCGSKHLLFSFAWSGGSLGKWVGLFDTLIAVPANDPMPFAMFDPWSANVASTSANISPFGATSRTPLPAADTVWKGINSLHGGLYPYGGLPFAAATGLTQFNALGGSNDVWNAPTEVGVKYLVQGIAHTSDGRILNLRGKVPGLVTVGAGSGLYINDEFTFDSKTFAVVSYVTNGAAIAADKAFSA
jgi:hypothetical protein